ncbi:MAG: LPXTG cell wall anchor domain-containing protein [Ilumatobacter sp.]|uniref:LPXTG cell wall anchor domain-containing protein n=1 Tax=Ilumatobacter sp. TaxID=1967498 RepID=UPI00262FA14B|nr:LPXTG cell wall anchor domain-containing protein [Ilumatobacter sp.]MDJ0771447.1 LPXTG cell wall anchor domain-containing protein [Ilumatobacter sp.]
MKKIAAALMIAGAALMAGGAVVDAYPPGSGPFTAEPTSPIPGQDFTITVDDCAVGEIVIFSFPLPVGAVVVNEPCVASGGTPAFMLGFLAAPATGTASATFTAPDAPGTYTGSAEYSGRTLNFVITVQAAPTTTTTAAPAGGLPATGSSSGNTTMIIATVLLLAGAGMFGVAQVRRRQVVAG